MKNAIGDPKNAIGLFARIRAVTCTLKEATFGSISHQRNGPDIQEWLKTWVLQAGLEASLLQSHSPKKYPMKRFAGATGP